MEDSVMNPNIPQTREEPRVPLLDLRAQYSEIESEITEAVRRLFRTQQFILGPNVKELEQRIAEYSQCRYGVGVSSGTDALLVALMALDIGPEHGVITTPYSFFATAGALTRLGALPVFCDIDPETYNISPPALAELIDTRCEMRAGNLIDRQSGRWIKAVMPVHLFGQTTDMDPVLELARRFNLKVIEDAAQAIGAEYSEGRRAGSMGDVACFSFFPSKNLGAFGDAGMCTTNDPELAEKMEILRVHGGKPKYFHAVVGGNFRLDALQAVVLLVKLEHLDRWTERRQQNAAFYDGALKELGLGASLSTPITREGHRHIFNQYVLRVSRRDDLQAWLSEAGVGTAIYYPLSLHRQQCFAYLGYEAEDFPESNRAAEETLAIPIYPELTDDQLRYVTRQLETFFKG
jgi:dTDP-4-amino-4,6-dideoxygalactose transaminase